MKARVHAVAYALPEAVLDNRVLAELFTEWTPQRILEKIGIEKRHIAAEGECASDLAVRAAEALFRQTGRDRSTVDYLLVCTQSPDYLLPSTACLVQNRLRLSTACGALDFNLGCSGYVYGLGIAKGLVETEQARNILLITADTYSKYLEPSDKNVRTVFGDGAAATWIGGAEDGVDDPLGPFVYGTDGAGAQHLIIEAGGSRTPHGCGDPYLRMNGPAIFAFTLQAVPAAVEQVLVKAKMELAQVDRFVLHQANRFMLESLRKKMAIPADKFVYAMDQVGNTVSSSIPIALAEAERQGVLKPGMRVMLVGFGVGLSWGACLMRW